MIRAEFGSLLSLNAMRGESSRGEDYGSQPSSKFYLKIVDFARSVCRCPKSACGVHRLHLADMVFNNINVQNISLYTC